MNTSIFLTVTDNVAVALVGRDRTPLADADIGVQQAFDQALTDFDGSVDGPLVSGDYLLMDDKLVRKNRVCDPQVIDVVFGNTEDARVLCPACGAAIEVDPWIRTRQDGAPKLATRLGTLKQIPAHVLRATI